MRFESTLTAALALAVLVVAAPISMADDSVVVKPRFKKGDKFTIRLHEDMTRTMEGAALGGQKIKVEVEQRFWFKAEVTGGRPSSPELTLTWDRIAVKMDHPAMQTDFDSAVDEEQPEAFLVEDLFNPLIGRKLTVVLNERGMAKKLTGMDAAWEFVEDEYGPSPMLDQVRVGMNNDQLQFITIDAHNIFYPNQAVKVGDTYERTCITPHPLAGEIRRTYACKVAEIDAADDDRRVKITYTHDAKPVSEEWSPPNNQGIRAKFLTGKYEGHLIFSKRHGRFLLHEERGESKLVMATPLPQGEAEIQVTQSGTATAKLGEMQKAAEDSSTDRAAEQRGR